MCDFKEFKLCTCKNILDNNELPTWSLSRVISDMQEEKLLLLGGLFYDDENSPKIIREKFIVKQLNDKNCFDFDYTPIEGDELTIFFKDIDELSFVFQSGIWGVNLPVGYKAMYFDELKSGVVLLD